MQVPRRSKLLEGLMEGGNHPRGPCYWEDWGPTYPTGPHYWED